MSISVELASLHSAGLARLVPAYLYEHYKEDLNERLLVNLIGDLDHLIETIRASNSFQVLTLNESKRQKKTHGDISSSSSSSSKSLLSEISERLCNLFERYNGELNSKINLFGEQAALVGGGGGGGGVVFPDRAELLMYQRAILLKRLTGKHYELLVVFYRSVFDYFQKLNKQDGDDNDDDNDDDDDEQYEANMKSGSLSCEHYDDVGTTLIGKFHKLNRIL
jgi:hypothetical protein